MDIEFACNIDKGLRDYNDDRALILNQILYSGSYTFTSSTPCMAVVCDGCGGYEGGGFAAQLVLDTLSSTGINNLSTPDKLEQALTLANNIVLEKQQEIPQYSTMCTTIAGCIFCDDQTIIFHAGDSRVYRFDGNSLARMTIDHSAVQAMVDAGVISQEEALLHKDRNIITRCIGANSYPPDIYVSHPSIDFGETYLICSDGLWEVVGDIRIKEILLSGISLVAMANTLLSSAIELGSEDNITVCLCRAKSDRVHMEEEPFILD